MKKLIAICCIFCLLLQTPGMTELAYAIENEENSAPQVDTTTADYPLLGKHGINTARLEKAGKYSRLSEQEKLTASAYYGISAALFSACEAQGCSLLESVQIAKKCMMFSMPPAEYLEFAAVYQDAQIADEQLTQYMESKEKLSQQAQGEVLALMRKGYRFDNLIWALAVAQKVPCALADIIQEESAVSTDHEFAQFCDSYCVDAQALDDALRDAGKSRSALMDEVHSPDRVPPAQNEVQSNQTVGIDAPRIPNQHEFISAPALYFADQNEMVSATSGTFSYRKNIVDWKGKNGLDLTLDLVFQSGTNLYHGVNPLNSEDVRDWYSKNSALESGTVYLPSQITSTFGAGWSLDLPSVTSVLELDNPDNPNATSKHSVQYYNMPNGGKYKIQNNALVGYPKNDVTVNANPTEVLEDGTVVGYVFTYASGRYEKYDLRGNICVVGDKYGNEIRYTYHDEEDAYYYGELESVRDSLGRVLTFSYGTVASGDRGVAVRFNSAAQSEILMTFYSTPNTNGIYTLNMLMPGIEGKEFSYEIKEVQCIDRLYEGSLSEINGVNQVINMTQITYITGLQSHYRYELCAANNGQRGAKQTYRVCERYETDPTKPDESTNGVDGLEKLKTRTFSYQGDYSGYGTRISVSEDQKALYADPNNLPESHTYSVWRTENGIRTETIYNHKHMPKQIRTVNMSTGALLSEQQITYDSYLLPVSQTTTTGQVTSTETMQNDAYGNVVKQWSTRAGGAQNAEYLTQSTYDARFNQLTARTWKKDENTTVQEVYTLSEDGKHPVQKEVKVNGATAEKTGYLYDTYGNVTEERRYTSETQFLATHYSYTDAAGIARPEWMNFNGAHLTGVWQDGGTDIDGGAIGTIAEYYEYDLYGNCVKATDARNHTTQYEYDAHRRVTKITDAQNKTEQFVHTNQWIKSPLGEFTGTDHTLTYTDKKGTVTRYVYDAAANLRQVVDVSSGEVLQGYDYDKKYRIIKERNVQLATSGYETSYTYDCLNRVTQKETKNQANETIAKETAAYDDGTTGAYLKTTHTIVGDAAAPSVVSTQYVNAYGDVEKIGHITGGEEYFDTYTYNYVGEKVQEKSARAQQKNWTEAYTKKWEYDYAGRVLKEYNVDGDYISYQYNMLGQKVKFGDYRANASSAPYYTTYQYDAAGNLICETTPQTASQNRVSQYKYDKTGNRTLERILRDVGSQNQPIYDETAYEYDFAGHVTRAACGTSETLYTYDALGQCLTMSTGSTSEKHVTSYTYDRFGNNITVTSAGKTDRYEYDANGLRTKHIDKADVTHSYTPNALGQTRSIWTPKSGTRSFTYTLTGQVWEQSSGSYFMTNTYDDMGRIKKVTEPGLEKNYTYDVEGNRESFETKVLGAVGQSLNYTYDKRGNMTEVSAPGTGISATYSYDENGNMTRELSDVYSDTDYIYNRDNTVSEISTFRIISSENLEYTYYRNGNIKTESGNNKTTTYEYDTQNRLSKETVGGSVMTYTYDSFGNRATKTVEDSGALQQEVSYTYDDANRLKKTVEEQHNTYETYTTYYQYDANGNLTLRAREIIAPSAAAGTTALLQNSTYIDTFQFNDYGEMTSAYVNGKQCSYSYRPDGLRINKMVDGVRTRHVLDGQNVSMDLNDDWSTKFSFIRGVRLVGYIDGANGSKYFYNFNAHGDVLGAVGGLNSTAQTRYTYDAFGNSSKTGTSENPFGYFGQYHDAETGLIYLRARYYDPNAGRFISEDPIRDGMNWYAYVANNPVTFVDPTGLVIQFTGVVDKDDVRFKTLQDLTDDELYLEYDEATNMTYVRYIVNKAARRMTGTSLVRRVIDHKRTCKIIDTNCMTGYTYHTSHEGAQTPGVGSDVLIDLDFDSPGKYYVVRNRKVQEEIGKTFIELGHELIHALRAMNGNMKFDKYGVYGTPWRAWSFFGFQFDTTATADQDELDTVGINYNGEEGGHYPASEWQMTENALRKENGEPPRVTY